MTITLNGDTREFPDKESMTVTKLIDLLALGPQPVLVELNARPLIGNHAFAAVDDLFGQSGIYANPQGSGQQWERWTSLEFIDPDHPDGSNALFANRFGMTIPQVVYTG